MVFWSCALRKEIAACPSLPTCASASSAASSLLSQNEHSKAADGVVVGLQLRRAKRVYEQGQWAALGGAGQWCSVSVGSCKSFGVLLAAPNSYLVLQHPMPTQHVVYLLLPAFRRSTWQ